MITNPKDHLNAYIDTCFGFIWLIHVHLYMYTQIELFLADAGK